MIKLSENRSWCPLPWKHVATLTNGDLQICSMSSASPLKGQLKDERQNVLNARDVDLDKARNCDILKEVRTAMLEGVRHDVCYRCNREDDLGSFSMRAASRAASRGRFDLDQARAATRPDGSIDPRSVSIEYLDLRLGNLCNLKCRMCSPSSSSGWYGEYFEDVGKGFHTPQGRVALARENGRVRVSGHNPYLWFDEATKFWSQLHARTHEIRDINFTGGEPLMIEAHFEFLERLVASGRAGDIKLKYFSNITTLPGRALRLWEGFRSVIICASIDGHGPINEFIRYPSKWETIEKNLRRLRDVGGNLRVAIATTVQLYNIYFLPELLRWVIEEGFCQPEGPLPTFVSAHPLYNPKYLSTQALPKNAKEMVSLKFDRFYRDWFSPYIETTGAPEPRREALRTNMRQLLESSQNHMWSEDRSELLPVFLDHNAKMDSRRSESFDRLMPEIASEIREHVRRGA